MAGSTKLRKPWGSVIDGVDAAALDAKQPSQGPLTIRPAWPLAGQNQPRERRRRRVPGSTMAGLSTRDSPILAMRVVFARGWGL
jgi:hypothetical protein